MASAAKVTKRGTAPQEGVAVKVTGIPQQSTVLSDNKAQVCLPPAEIVVAFVIPVTATGVGDSVLVPSPS
jgi:hypothetical protein